MTRVRSPYMASATPMFTVEVVFPTPPFWLAIVTTRIRPGAGKGSWSAACNTRVARSASMAIGLSNSAVTATSAARLVRSRSPGSVIGTSSLRPCSTWNGLGVPRGTRRSPGRARGSRRAPARHDHHGSGCRSEVGTDSPDVHVPHPGRLEFRDQVRHLGGRAGADERDELRPGPQQPAAPADEPGERGHRAGGDHVDRADRTDDGPLLGTAPHDAPRCTERFDHVLQELHPPSHRLDQGQRHVGAGQAQRDTRQAGAAADVDHPGTLGHRLGQRRTVEHVPVPQPGDLTWADQAADDADTGQHGDVACRRVGGAAEERRGHWRHFRNWLVLETLTGLVVLAHCSGRTTTRRFGSSPSDSLRTPGAAATTSWTTLRSKGFIGASRSGWRLCATRSAAAEARLVRSARRLARKPPMSSISRLRTPVDWATARRVSSCSASSVAPSGPISVLSWPPTTATEARSPSTSRSMSPSTSRMSSSRSR